MRQSAIYDESSLAESSIAEEYALDEEKLYNSKDPNLAILHEKPEHRIIIMLKVQGKSNLDIYRAFGGTFNVANGKPNNDGRYTQAWISQVLRQPWARKAVLDEIRRTANSDGFQQLVASEVDNSLYTLIEIRDKCKDSEPNVSRGCANDILDRHFGKPTQHVMQEAKIQHSLSDISTLDKELAETQREIARLTGEQKTETVTNQ